MVDPELLNREGQIMGLGASPQQGSRPWWEVRGEAPGKWGSVAVLPQAEQFCLSRKTVLVHKLG